MGTGGQQDVFTLRGPLSRASLRLGVLRLPSTATRLAWLIEHLNELPGSGIIYALTIGAAEDTARALTEAGHSALAYTGRTDAAEREELETALKENQVKALVATSALGMGFDKPDLGFVVHLGAPSSPVAYYQQVGRAGRATDSADVLLLPGAEDREIWEYFATASMPTEEKSGAVLTALAEHGGPLSVAALETRVNIKRTPLELLLKVLAVDGAVERVSGGWQSTGRAWEYDAPRYDRVRKARIAEQQAMMDYQFTTECRMQFLAAQLDDRTAQPCGRCDVCAGAWYATTVHKEASAAADSALHRAGAPLEPRAQWPSGMDRLGIQVKGKIPEEERADRGRSLARLTDLGWGQRLREIFRNDDNGQPMDATVDAALGRACIGVLAQWDWSVRPTAVVAMPSLSRPELVSSLAQGLAAAGHLPFLGTLRLNQDVPRGSHGGNSAYRLAEVWDRFSVPPEIAQALREQPQPSILLVDDLVDSRWTLTVAARELRLAGATNVLPFALAAQLICRNLFYSADHAAIIGSFPRGCRDPGSFTLTAARSCSGFRAGGVQPLSAAEYVITVVAHHLSTEQVRGMLTQEQLDHVRIIEAPAEGTTAAAPRTAGLEHTDAKYICFLDSDDSYQPARSPAGSRLPRSATATWSSRG